MELRAYYERKDANKLQLRISYDKKSGGRPAWILIQGFPKDVNFIKINLGKQGRKGHRIVFYKTYLPEGLFMPVDPTAKEMQEFYNKFSQIYDPEIKDRSGNIGAGSFLCKKLRKYSKTNVSMLDLGAGTGLLTEIFLDAGFKDITLVDYSIGMLKEAKKRRKLKACKFIQADFRKLKLVRKYDAVISLFCLGGSSYFNPEELEKVLSLVKKQMKPQGIIAVIGHFDQSAFRKSFKELESGTYTLDNKRKYYSDYFIGRNSN